MDESDRDFLEWIDKHQTWYEAEADKWERVLYVCKVLTFVSFFIAIVTTASATKESFEAWGKWLILAGTLMSAFSSEALAQFRVRRMEDLRESGNLEVAHLYALARDKLDEFKEDRPKIHALKDEARERLRLIEQAQHKGFVDIDAGSTQDGRTRSRPSRTLLGKRRDDTQTSFNSN